MPPNQDTVSDISEPLAIYARIDQQIESAVQRTLGDLDDERRASLDATFSQNRHIVAT